MRLLLDTQALILAVESPELIPRRAMAALRNPDNVREVSSVSLTEIAIKHARKKLRMTKADVQTAIADLDLRLLPYTVEHALQLFDLPFHHHDPFDRQLIAQAIIERIPLVGGDLAFPPYKDSGLKVIWK